MSKRIEKIASYVKNGIGVADVGTDHAYLPILLAQRGYIGNIFATDINSGPLKKAENDILRAGLEEKITLLLCDGLDACMPELIDTIVIAGMGGDTIVAILDKAEWCSREDITLILQPVTKPEILRYWLVNNDFYISSDDYIEDNGIIYQIICAQPGKSERYSDAELFVGKYEKIKDNLLARPVLEKHINRFSEASCSLENAVKPELISWKIILENMRDEMLSEKWW